MIIFDFQQVALSNIHQQINHLSDTLNEDMIRHMILNTLRSYILKFRSEYGNEVVLAYDSKNYWRKQIFSNYKSNRKKVRESQDLDWKEVYRILDKIKLELKLHSHYKVIEVDTVEADDIIAVLSNMNQKTIILSSDKDFIQLHNNNVKQYSPIMKKYIESDDIDNQLYELIIYGDRSDGIPNILSDDDVFVNGQRQKPITKTKLNEWKIHGVPKQLERNYNRNKMLIDLSAIPESIKTKIMDTYMKYTPSSKLEFMNYMITNRLRELVSVIDEF